jgi:hypothetical protein
MHFRKPGYSHRKPAQRHRFSDEFDCVMETVRMGPPIHRSLGWIPPEGDKVLDSLVFEFFENRSSLIFGLAHDREMTHDLETAFAMNPIDEVDRFVARASARPVRNRAEGGIQPLNDLYFTKEVFFAFVCLWRKELNREGQPRPGIEVG